MIIHYLLTAIKHFRTQWSFSMINLFGLATAMAVCLLIVLYVYRELSYDRFHAEADNIYRVSVHFDMQDNEIYENWTSPPMGPDLLEAFPEVINQVRLSGRQAVNLWQDGSFRTINRTYFADNTFFDIFCFDLLQGHPVKALADPYSLVVTESLAKQLFPGGDALGKVVRLDDGERHYVITGVAADSPPNSHIQFDMLRSFSTLMEESRSNMSSWGANMGFQTYLLMAEGVDILKFEKKTEPLTYEKLNYQFEGMGVHLTLHYFPMKDIRLRSPFSSEAEEAGTIWKVWLFSTVALFVLFIAGFNYVNLCVAMSGKRAKEIGVRKVLGANRASLRQQLYFETLFFTTLSFACAILVVEFMLPFFNGMLNTNLELFSLPWWSFLVVFLFFAGFFGFLAGIYPAWYMSSFEPVKIMKGEFWTRPGGFQLKSLLMFFQFIISMALITCTLVVFLQVRYFYTKDLGFEVEGLIAVRAEKREDADLFRQVMDAYPWVVSKSISTSFPIGASYMEGILPEGAEPGFLAHRFWTDLYYLETLGGSLKEGRLFTREDGLETSNVIVNETLVNKAGWTSPLGKTIERSGITYTVTGVVHDYHFRSLHHEIEPRMMNVLGARPAHFTHPFWLLIRYEGVHSADVVLTLQEEWTTVFPDKTFYYTSISQLLDQQFVNERNFGRMFLSFTTLAIVIAMLGVLGLSSFAAQKSRKESAIRKVMGASVRNILFRMSGTFLKWVVLSSIVALPLAYWYMEKWLAGFAYSIAFPYWTMVVSVVAMVMVVVAVVVSQSIRAVHKNPADVLKAE